MRREVSSRRCDTCAAWLLSTTAGPTCAKCLTVVQVEDDCFGYGDAITCGSRAVAIVVTHYMGDLTPNRGVPYCRGCLAQCRRDAAALRGTSEQMVRSERVERWLTTTVVR